MNMEQTGLLLTIVRVTDADCKMDTKIFIAIDIETADGADVMVVLTPREKVHKKMFKISKLNAA